MADSVGREGWQMEGSYEQRKWHYIRGTESLCGKFGFYFGEVASSGLVRSISNGDCAECKRRVDRELTKRESDGSEPTS